MRYRRNPAKCFPRIVLGRRLGDIHFTEENLLKYKKRYLQVGK